jgi:peptidyl-Asp metalloendopeptidase
VYKILLAGILSLLVVSTNLSAEALFIPENSNQIVKMDNKGSLERTVRVNTKALQSPSIKVDTFDSNSLDIIVTKRDIRAVDDYTVYGKIPTHGKSQVILTFVKGTLVGNIQLLDNITHEAQIYEITPSNMGVYNLKEVLPEGFPPDHPDDLSDLAVPRAYADASADTGATIDVMIVYSSASGSAIGAAAQSFAQQSIDSVNNAYANSNITTRMRLVYTYVSSYVESGDFNTDLNRLTSASDGYLDEVHSLRDTYRADMVSMFIENGQYCGLGWIGPYSSYAFTTVNRGCAVSNLSFAHELGHNFGALHDPYVDPSTSPYPYGHGYAVPAERWRTIMAYNNVCTAASTSCTRLAYFSNPNKLYGSTPMGTVATSNNARVINDNAAVVANFKQQSSTLPPPGSLYLIKS